MTHANADEVPAVRPLLEKHCIECHGADAQEGDLRFDKLTGSPKEEPVWASILEQLKKDAMPPKDELRLSREEHSALTAWIERSFPKAAQALAQKMQRPENGNLVPHDKLFDPKTAARAPKIAASPARLWRTLPKSYEHKLLTWLISQQARWPKRDRVKNPLPAPFGLHSAHELKNYAFLYTLEGPQTAGLANNARLALIHLLTVKPKNDKSLLRKMGGAKELPSAKDVDQVIVDLYRYWAGRAPEPKELDADRTSVLASMKRLGNRDGLVAGLVPIMIQPEAVFHLELGTPRVPGSQGKPTILPPNELADALDRALRDRRGADAKPRNPNWQIAHGNPIARDFFVIAAEQGKLNSREDVLAVLEQMAKNNRMSPLSQSETVGRFLEEYFDYTHYFSVFKCVADLKKEAKAKRLLGAFDERFDDGIPEKVVVRTRETINAILAEDKQVLTQLLTVQTDDLGRSDAVYKAYFTKRKAALERSIKDVQDRLARKNLDPKLRVRWEKGKELEKRKKTLADFLKLGRKRVRVGHPSNVGIVELGPLRIGVLTQRSWLISHSNNVENHAIHRGKWIRERLLGGRIPDVPITVDAALPTDPKKTLRERMAKTQQSQCIRCHRLMDPLGLPFEGYDHFGSYRKTEVGRPVVTTGEIIDSGDPELDGPVAGPEELVQKLAKSQRVQQVFVRHAFRFWMGRNETLNDARTIQNAYMAYKQSDGSMSALLKSLLTSDAFLYRTGTRSEGETK